VDVLANETYWVELVNGHRLRAFVAGKSRLRLGPFVLGQKVMLQVSSYDLSEGRIIAEKTKFG